MIYLITYDLPAQEASSNDYINLYKEIEHLGNSCRFQKSAWVTDSLLTAEQIYDKLISLLDMDGDKVFVAEIKGDFCAWVPGAVEWFLAHLDNAQRLRQGSLIFKTKVD